MFSDLSAREKEVVYLCLKHAVASNSGIGMQNGDQGHPAYTMGAAGNGMYQGDSPFECHLFKMLSFLQKDLSYTEGQPDFSTWQKFCQFVIESYANPKRAKTG